MKIRIYAMISIAVLSGQVFATPVEQACITSSTTITQKLNCLQGVTATLVPGEPSYTTFDIQFTQPIDHGNPAAGTFSQHLILLHVDENEPMVLETSGYQIFGAYPTLVSSTFGTNQLQVEHRYFAKSTPAAPVDWTKLNIKQSADDFHAITMAFKQIYAKNWLNTGGSKGGMTSLYHKRFYPGDVNGTLADVAPLSFSDNDQRYAMFLANVGGDAYKTCRENFIAVQRQVLKARSEITPTLAGSFSQIGGADVALENLVEDATFLFWQYMNPKGPEGCSGIPVEGLAHDAFSYLNKVNAISQYTDAEIVSFLAYDYQSATQLGGPENYMAPLVDLQQYPVTPFVDLKNIPHAFDDGQAMRDIDQWARTAADKIIYVYGEFDPWTAGAFPLSESAKETYRYLQPGGNHGSNFAELAPADSAGAIAVLSRWLGKPPVVPMVMIGAGFPRSKTVILGNVELNARRRLHLP